MEIFIKHAKLPPNRAIASYTFIHAATMMSINLYMRLSNYLFLLLFTLSLWLTYSRVYNWICRHFARFSYNFHPFLSIHFPFILFSTFSFKTLFRFTSGSFLHEYTPTQLSHTCFYSFCLSHLSMSHFSSICFEMYCASDEVAKNRNLSKSFFHANIPGPTSFIPFD